MMRHVYKEGQYLLLYGGTDVNPELYGQKALPQTQAPDRRRDAEELAAIQKAMDERIPIIGICRGGQLLCVANGGTLWQHSFGHGNSHGLHCRPIESSPPNLPLLEFDHALAGHHQIMKIDGTKHQLLGWKPGLTEVYGPKGQPEYIENSPEVVFFPETRCLSIQPHPEWEEDGEPFREYVKSLIKELFNLEGVI